MRSDVAGCASACLRLYDDAACQALPELPEGCVRSHAGFTDDDGFPNDFGGGELIRVKAKRQRHRLKTEEENRRRGCHEAG
ncbi:MAG: hypothetical protein ACLR23_00130 [Clostridia bacterium]